MSATFLEQQCSDFFSRASDLRTATSQSSSLVVVEEVVNEMLFPVVVIEVDLCVLI